MKIQYINNHIVIPVQTNSGVKNALLDTGNPVSTVFNDDAITDISICDVNFKLQSAFMIRQFKRMINWNDVSSFVKTQIDGFIGYDFLIKNDISIDLKNYDLSLNQIPEDFDLLNIDLFMNVPILTINIEKLAIKAVFDTGAMYSILNSNHKNTLIDKNECIDDYNPILGNFKANLYSGNIQVGNSLINNCTIACSEKYDTAMNMLNGQKVEGFLGIGSLEGKNIFLSCKNKQIRIKKA